MDENKKTVIFVGAALVAALLAVEPWHRKPASVDDKVVELFPAFKDPETATSLQIAGYDESTGTPRDFSVRQLKGRWVIPSHDDYPADAHQHMAEAATTVMGLESLNMISTSVVAQEVYGVIDPDSKTLKPGAVGVGTRVTLKDDKDKVLADLIIGKTVTGQPDQHYVRLAGHDQIYIVKLRIDKLSTRFGDWIEKDLLKLNGFDVTELQLNDYSISTELGPRGRMGLRPTLRSKMKLAYDNDKTKWSLVDFISFDNKGLPKEAKLQDDEELNTKSLNDLKSALDDLQIVDVERKPAGLGRDLRANEELVNNDEALGSLAMHGFYPVSDGNDGIEMLSSQGEVLCLMKDGIEYTLRFGVPTLKEDRGSADADNMDKKSGKNRYLLVTCKLHEELIPKPQLTELPTLPGDEPVNAEKKDQPADETQPAEPKDDAAPADKPAADQKNDSAPDAKKPAAKQSSDAREKNVFWLTAADKAVNDKTADKKPADAKPAAGKAPADKAATDKTASDKAAADKAVTEKADAPAAVDKPSATEEKAAVPPAAEEHVGGKIRAEAKEKKLLAEKRAAIEKENKRQQMEYDSKLKKARERNKELTDRFADWYFVISDDVYHKIHLSHDEIIKKKDAATDKANGVGDFKGMPKGLGLPGHHDHDHDDHDHDDGP